MLIVEPSPVPAARPPGCVATFNVNSIRARVASMSEWLDRSSPDVVCLTETRCREDQFPYELFTDRGYAVVLAPDPHAPSRNGVALLSRVGLRDVHDGFMATDTELVGWQPEWPRGEGRLVIGSVGPTGAEVTVVAVYVPNGRSISHWHYAYKLAWLDALVELVAARTGPMVVLGDVNVARHDVDISTPAIWRDRVLASKPERARIEALETAGAVDLWRHAHPDPPRPDRDGFTWHGAIRGRPQGMRLDLIAATDGLVDRCVAVRGDQWTREHERPSDHTPVVAELAW